MDDDGRSLYEVLKTIAAKRGLSNMAKCTGDCPLHCPSKESHAQLEEREFSADQRKKLAKSGAAMPDGSYPIENEGDLHNAIQAFGRSPDNATKAHIKKRAAALGKTSMLPDAWESAPDDACWIDSKWDGNDLLHIGMSVQEALPMTDSHDGLRDKLHSEINAHVAAGHDMDGDGDDDSQGGDYQATPVAVFPKHVVYSMGGKMMQVGHNTDADGDVHLTGKPKEVEQSFTPVSGGATGSLRKESIAESFSESAISFSEGAYNPASGDLSVTVIKPGVSLNNRYYAPDMLKRDYKVFEGAKMFANHATDREVKERPEGSITDWVGNLHDVKAESDGTLVGKANIIDPDFKAKIDMLHSKGLLPKMGVSIRAAGEARDGQVGGKKVKVIESITHAKSVDFVTFAGAGGRVEN